MVTMRIVNRTLARLAALWVALLPAVVLAGPPFLTDDPAPADPGHWEIYAPLIEAEGSGKDFEGALSSEINYGATKDVQVTVEMPLAYAHDADGWHWGAGDLAASIKYRFYHDEAAGLQIAAFPGVTLPTASNGMGADRVTVLLPISAQQDLGKWSVFGSGGYALNPGPGKRDYWTGGIAVTRRFGERLLVGLEANRQGADRTDSSSSTSLGVGAIYDLPGPLRLLASGGPTFDAAGQHGFHTFTAVGLDF